jgi:hypothetical protein
MSIFDQDESLNPALISKRNERCVDGETPRRDKARRPGVLATPAARARRVARARGIEAHILCAGRAAGIIECRELGAHVTLRRASPLRRRDRPTQSGRRLVRHVALKEPYRIEGKKGSATNWPNNSIKTPDAILYRPAAPGLIGMWRRSMKWSARWIDRKRRACFVQASGCSPIVHAFEAKENSAEFQRADQLKAMLKAIGGCPREDSSPI